MGVAIIADAHLGGPGGAAGPMIEQLDALPGKGCRHLVLLGDIFHVWVGSPKYETPEIRELLPALGRLRDAGVKVEYVEGNRDFFLEKSPYARYFDRVATEVSFAVDGRKYLAVHGDGLNEEDRQYLFWRWLSKSPPVRVSMLRLPGGIARRLVGSTEKHLAKTNFKHKDALPERAIVAYGRQRLAEGYDALLLGHFHEPRRFEVPEGEIRIFDAWFNSRRIEWLEGESR